MILGSDWLVKEKIKLDFDKRLLYIHDPSLNKVISLKFIDCFDQLKSTSMHLIQTDQEENSLIYSADEAENCDVSCKEKLNLLLKKYDYVFLGTPECTHFYEHEILIRNIIPLFKRSFPIPSCHQEY